MLFLLAIADLIHSLSNNRSSIGMIDCFQKGVSPGRASPISALLCAKYKQAFLPYISNLVTGSYTLNDFRLKETEDVSNSTTAEESSCSYEAFGSTHKKLIGAAWLGLPSQGKLQIPSQPKSFKTERDKHFSRLFPLY